MSSILPWPWSRYLESPLRPAQKTLYEPNAISAKKARRRVTPLVGLGDVHKNTLGTRDGNIKKPPLGIHVGGTVVREAAFAQIDQCDGSKLAPLGVVNSAEAQRPARRCEETKVVDSKIVEVDALRAHVGLHLLHRRLEQAGMHVVDQPVAVQDRAGRVGHGVEPLNSTTLLSKALGLAEMLPPEPDGHGNFKRGARRINQAEAAIVRRIFQDYVAGSTPREIAKALNAERVPPPSRL
jgi:Recombinase